jgi:hypothetical protein
MEICLATREVIQHTPKGPSFLFGGEGRGGEEKGVGFEILLLFPMCSHQFFNGFPKHSASSQRVPQHVLNSSTKEGHYNIFILGLYKS